MLVVRCSIFVVRNPDSENRTTSIENRTSRIEQRKTMKIDLNEFSAPLAFSYFNGLVFSVLFWIRGVRQKRKSDIIFGFVILASCISIMDWMLGYMGIHIFWNELLFFPYSIGFLIGPLMYLYLKCQINSEYQFQKKDFLYFIPYFIYLSYHLLVFIQGKGFVENWSENFHSSAKIGELEVILSTISNIIYLFWSFQLFQNYSKWLPTEHSDTEIVSFTWYRLYLIIFALAFLTDIAYVVVGFAGVQLDYVHIWWEKFLFAILIYFICIRGYTQIQPKRLVFNPEKINEEKEIQEVLIPDFEEWKAKVLKAMEKDKMYLDSEITLSDLANRLKTHTSLLSGIINKGFGRNFNDFINEFRVKEFQEKINLPENKHFTLLGIAYDCGFNSKATFNRAYKKITGKAPSSEQSAVNS
jgi:AraC-like DNA-binding protein